MSLGRRGFLGLLAIALLAVACRDARPEPSPSDGATGPSVRTAAAEPLEAALGRFEPELAERARSFARSVPESVPRLAVALFTFLDLPRPSSGLSVVPLGDDGMARTRFVAGNPASNTLEATLVCLREARQVPCAPEAPVWRVSLRPQSLAALAVAVPAARGDRLDLVLLVAGDDLRPRPGTRVLTAVAEDRPAAPSGVVEASAHERVLGGCDLATITVTDRATKVYSPPRNKSRDAELFVVVQPCEGPDRVVRLVPIGDRRRVLEFPGEHWHAPVRVRGDVTLVVPIPKEGRGVLGEVQVVALQYGEVGPNAWVTPAATFRA